MGSMIPIDPGSGCVHADKRSRMAKAHANEGREAQLLHARWRERRAQSVRRALPAERSDRLGDHNAQHRRMEWDDQRKMETQSRGGDGVRVNL